MRIFLIDDDSDDRRLAARSLGQGLGSPEIVEIGTDAELETMLNDPTGPTLVVTDYDLGWTDAFDVLHRVRTVYPDCPLIVLTGNGDKSLAARLITAGANDYVDKHGPNRLGEAAQSVIRRAAEMAAHLA